MSVTLQQLGLDAGKRGRVANHVAAQLVGHVSDLTGHTPTTTEALILADFFRDEIETMLEDARIEEGGEGGAS